MSDPDNDNITTRSEFGYASVYCKIFNRTRLVVKTPEYMDDAEYQLKIILYDNNKYQKSRQFYFKLYIKGLKKPVPYINQTIEIKPWNITFKRMNPLI